MAGARETRAVCLSISVYLVGRVATAEPVAQDGPRRVEGGAGVEEPVQRLRALDHADAVERHLPQLLHPPRWHCPQPL